MRTSYITLITGFVMMTAMNVSWASSGSLSSENPLGNDYYLVEQAPRIDFNDSYMLYKPGRRDKPGKMVAGTIGSAFTLITPTNEAIEYSGIFSLSAKISKSGELLKGNFSFRSSDEMFGFGTKEVCWWKNCSDVPVYGNVFSGVLTDIGWSSTTGILEFASSQFSGWACDVLQKCTDQERLWFNLGGDSLADLTDAISDNKFWLGKADGTAVIPVPAAVWLFGSGLIALLGFCRRRKV